MRSFFNRPTWANVGEEDSRPDFYRRSDQTYGDVTSGGQGERTTADQASAPVVNDGDSDVTFVDSKSPTPQEASQRNHNHDNDNTVDSRGAEIDVLVRNAKSTPTSCDTPSIAQVADHESDPSPPDPRSSRTNEPDATNGVNHRSHECEGPGNEEQVKCIQDDAIVQILITSEIKNTKPLIVHRKMSQALRDVRLAWCRRQEKVGGLETSVFLTWKGRRLFDVTTCKSLGIRAGDNNFVGIPDSDDSEATAANNRIHLEAVTEDTIQTRSPGPSSQTGSPDSCFSPSEDLAMEKHVETISIVLRCPGVGSLEAQPTMKTQISWLVEKFQEVHRIPGNQMISLMFDGDRLDPELSIADYDIAESDMIDVVIR